MSYRLPFILTTQEIVDDIGFDVQKCTDFFQTGKELARVLNENKLNCTANTVFDGFSIPYYWNIFSGIQWIDYERKTVTLESEEVKQAYALLKEKLGAYLRFQKEQEQPHNSDALAIRFQRKEILFAETVTGIMDTLKYDIPMMVGAGESPVLFPYYDVNGEIVALPTLNLAVNHACKNKEAAYQFIKLLLTSEFNVTPKEDGTIDLIDNINMPTNTTVLQKYLESRMETHNQDPAFLNGKPVVVGAFPEALLEQFLAYLPQVTTVCNDPPIGYQVLDKMKPYLYDDVAYEKCIQDAQQLAEIYISE